MMNRIFKPLLLIVLAWANVSASPFLNGFGDLEFLADGLHAFCLADAAEGCYNKKILTGDDLFRVRSKQVVCGIFAGWNLLNIAKFTGHAMVSDRGQNCTADFAMGKRCRWITFELLQFMM